MLRQKRNMTFSFIMAIPNLFFVPYGTVLGTLTLIVLNRPSVKKLYNRLPPAAPPIAPPAAGVQK